jgi:hypothetical protein
MDIMTKTYVLYVEEKKTKKYFVKADTEEQAKERYLIDGLTSNLYDKDEERKILHVALAEFKLD